MEQYRVIGLMSGTSLDGLDIAYCTFNYDGAQWGFNIEEAETIHYDQYWLDILKGITQFDGLKLSITDLEYGSWLGKTTKKFIEKVQIQPDYISSHGHTVFHQPDIGLTLQIGNGMNIMKETGVTTISNFRLLDVALGGQGAPLVPLGDQLLFAEYEFCLNLGGIANVSFDHYGKRIAYDICPANMVLNFLANKMGYAYDPEGSLSKKGKIIPELLKKLNGLPFYKKDFPKSLGYEWVKENILHELSNIENVVDLLCTCTEHISTIISDEINKYSDRSKKQKLLVTGGGAYNDQLIALIKLKCHNNIEVILPSKKIIEYKEALIFAFLGTLRVLGKPNCLSSVTGATIDNSGGVIHNNLTI